VEVALQPPRGGRRTGTVKRIVAPSPLRETPQCPVFDRCGGCDWQYLAYDGQIAWKRRILVENLQRIGGLTVDETAVTAVSGAPYGYRSRVRLHRGPDGSGFYARNSKEVVAIRHCPVATDGINALLAAAADGTVPRIADGATLVDGGEAVYRSDRDRRSRIMFADVPFTCATAGFSQSNRALLPELGRLMAATVHTDVLIDLYAGAGLLPVLVATYRDAPVRRVVCVEPDRRNTAYITENIAAVAPTAAVRVIPRTAEGAVSGLTADSRTTVLLDPPRGGLNKTVRRWLLAAAERSAGTAAPDIVYLSCDSAALSRDIAALSEGYVVESLTVIDFFPQTAHIETLAVLRPRVAEEGEEAGRPV
jgi:23S rRNA (uracil1939-C5)-methyltransferase